MRDEYDEVDYSSYYMKKDKNRRLMQSRQLDESSNNEPASYKDAVICLPETNENKQDEATLEKNKFKSLEKSIPMDIGYRYKREQADKKMNKKNSGKRKKRFGKGRGFAIIVASILLMFCSTLLIADTLSNGYVLAGIQSAFSKDKISKSYYAIEMDSYPDQITAKAVAMQLRQQGCAGYVVDDDGYRIMAEIYASEADAKSVLRKITAGGETAKIYVFQIKDVDYSIYPSGTRNNVKEALRYSNVIHTKLYDVTQQLGKNEIDKHNSLSEISTLRDTIKNMLVDFESACDSNVGDKNVSSVRIEMTAAIACLENLLNTTLKRPNLICDIRYTNVLIINAYRSLINGNG